MSEKEVIVQGDKGQITIKSSQVGGLDYDSWSVSNVSSEHILLLAETENKKADAVALLSQRDLYSVLLARCKDLWSGAVKVDVLKQGSRYIYFDKGDIVSITPFDV